MDAKRLEKAAPIAETSVARTIFFSLGDPLRLFVRKLVMLARDQIALAGTDVSQQPVAAQAAQAANEAGQRKMTEDKAHWAAQMMLIRDVQDQAAFASLYGHFAPRVKGFLMKSGADASLAEECTQEVMATVWHKAHMFDPAKASVATWIFTIARNRKIDVLRKARRPEPEDLPWGPEEEPNQADVLALQQESEALGRALADLPAPQRELIQKAYFGDLTHSEIAAQTGLPLGTIKSRIRLALERLRHALK